MPHLVPHGLNSGTQQSGQVSVANIARTRTHLFDKGSIWSAHQRPSDGHQEVLVGALNHDIDPADRHCPKLHTTMVPVCHASRVMR